MAPFIKFTTNSPVRSVFLNAEHIVRAVYDEAANELHLDLTEKFQKEPVRLSGEDAKAAVKILREL